MRTIDKTKDQLKKEREALSVSINNYQSELDSIKKELKLAKSDKENQAKVIAENEKAVKASLANMEKAKKDELEAIDAIKIVEQDNYDLKEEIKSNEDLLKKTLKAIDAADNKLTDTKDANSAEALKCAEILLGVCGQIEESANNLKQR